MAKFLVKARYATDGAQGLLTEGGSGRVDAVSKAIKKAGGKMEVFYFAFGETDAYVIADLPDNVTALALSLAVNASGKTTAEIVPLITPKQMDEATKKTMSYRAPGA